MVTLGIVLINDSVNYQVVQNIHKSVYDDQYLIHSGFLYGILFFLYFYISISILYFLYGILLKHCKHAVE